MSLCLPDFFSGTGHRIVCQPRELEPHGRLRFEEIKVPLLPFERGKGELLSGLPQGGQGGEFTGLGVLTLQGRLGQPDTLAGQVQFRLSLDDPFPRGRNGVIVEAGEDEPCRAPWLFRRSSWCCSASSPACTTLRWAWSWPRTAASCLGLSVPALVGRFRQCQAFTREGQITVGIVQGQLRFGYAVVVEAGQSELSFPLGFDQPRVFASSSRRALTRLCCA